MDKYVVENFARIIKSLLSDVTTKEFEKSLQFIEEQIGDKKDLILKDCSECLYTVLAVDDIGSTKVASLLQRLGMLNVDETKETNFVLKMCLKYVVKLLEIVSEKLTKNPFSIKPVKVLLQLVGVMGVHCVSYVPKITSILLNTTGAIAVFKEEPKEPKGHKGLVFKRETNDKLLVSTVSELICHLISILDRRAHCYIVQFVVVIENILKRKKKMFLKFYKIMLLEIVGWMINEEREGVTT